MKAPKWLEMVQMGSHLTACARPCADQALTRWTNFPVHKSPSLISTARNPNKKLDKAVSCSQRKRLLSFVVKYFQTLHFIPDHLLPLDRLYMLLASTPESISDKVHPNYGFYQQALFVISPIQKKSIMICLSSAALFHCCSTGLPVSLCYDKEAWTAHLETGINQLPNLCLWKDLPMLEVHFVYCFHGNCTFSYD